MPHLNYICNFLSILGSFATDNVSPENRMELMLA